MGDDQGALLDGRDGPGPGQRGQKTRPRDVLLLLRRIRRDPGTEESEQDERRDRPEGRPAPPGTRHRLASVAHVWASRALGSMAAASRSAARPPATTRSDQKQVQPRINGRSRARIAW